MRRVLARTVASVVLAATALAPQIAAACASCVASAYGDRGFNWAYIVLLVLPFAVLSAVGIVLAWSAGYRSGQLRTIVRTLIIEERT
jgi:predicted permease